MPYRMLVPALWYEGPPDVNEERFQTRGKSFMDRLRGRGGRKRRGSVDSDASAGSREGSASPPPLDGAQQQQPLPQQQLLQGVSAGGGPGWTPTATGGVRMSSQPQQQRQGYDGAYDNNAAPSAMSGGGVRRSLDQGRSGPSAYDRGLSGSQPPIGGSSNLNTGPYPSRPRQEKHAQFATAPGPPYRRDRRNPYPAEEEGDRGSLTPSDEDGGEFYYDPPEEVPRRRFGSKAERFFGIGEPAPPAAGEGGYEDGEKPRKRWQIWK